MPVSVHFNPEEERIVKSYCALHGISMSEAIAKFEANPVTVPWEQVKKKLGC